MSKRNTQIVPKVVSNFTTALKAFRDPTTPKGRKVAAIVVVIGVLGYIALPVDVIPDVIIGLGQVDDVVLALVSSGVISWLLTGDFSKNRLGELLVRLGIIDPSQESQDQTHL